MKDKFDIISENSFSNAGGALCYGKCQTLYGEAKKQACALQYISVPCGWNCSKHPDKPCCVHNRKMTEDKDNCRKNIDDKKNACQADCDAKAQSGMDDGTGSDSNPPTSAPASPAKPTPASPVVKPPVNTSTGGVATTKGFFDTLAGMSTVEKVGVGVGVIAVVSLVFYGVSRVIKLKSSTV